MREKDYQITALVLKVGLVIFIAAVIQSILT